MSKGTKHRNIRVPDPLWVAAREKTAERGETVAAVVNAALAAYVAEPDEAPKANA
jgi:hypothetical protein